MQKFVTIRHTKSNTRCSTIGARRYWYSRPWAQRHSSFAAARASSYDDGTRDVDHLRRVDAHAFGSDPRRGVFRRPGRVRRARRTRGGGAGVRVSTTCARGGVDFRGRFSAPAAPRATQRQVRRVQRRAVRAEAGGEPVPPRPSGPRCARTRRRLRGSRRARRGARRGSRGVPRGARLRAQR